MIKLYLRRSATDATMLELYSDVGGKRNDLWAVVHEDMIHEDNTGWRMREVLDTVEGPLPVMLSIDWSALGFPSAGDGVAELLGEEE